MKIEVHNRCSDFNSYRAARVKSLFNAESGCNFDLTAELPIDDNDWSVGPVAAQDWCFIRRDDSPEVIWRRELQPMGLRLFVRVLDDIARGVLVQIPQDEALATWEPSMTPPPLGRPDLPMLTDGRDDGLRRVVSREDLNGWNQELADAAANLRLATSGVTQ